MLTVFSVEVGWSKDIRMEAGVVAACLVAVVDARCVTCQNVSDRVWPQTTTLQRMKSASLDWGREHGARTVVVSGVVSIEVLFRRIPESAPNPHE